jgi:hypothetical protein
MEDNLKILKVKYLSNHWSDLPQILNFSPVDQTKSKNELIKIISNGRRPQILNLSSGYQTKIKNAWNEDNL